MNNPSPKRLGVAYGLAAYTWWGFIPLYFKAVASVPPLEVLAHRVVWSLVFLGLILWGRGRLKDVRAVLQDRRTMGLLTVTTLLIAVNWHKFNWSYYQQI